MPRPLRILAWPAFKAKLSPYNALLYRAMQDCGAVVEEFSAPRVLLGRYDVVHVHWPEYCVNERGIFASLFWMCSLFMAMYWVRLRGGVVVWTVHNLESHRQDHPRLERYFWNVFTALLNGYICLTEKGRDEAQRRYPALRRVASFVIPHGNIRDAYAETDLTREEARDRFQLSASSKVVLFFGSVQAYKGVTELIETFTTLTTRNAILVVAGKCSLPADERERIEAVAKSDERIHLHLKYIENCEVAGYMRAADLIVLPFRSILNSGSALLGLSFDRIVLVPDKTSMRELQRFAGANWLHLYTDELTPTLLECELQVAHERASTGARCIALQNGWNGLGWGELATMTLEAYGDIRRGKCVVSQTSARESANRRAA